MEEDVGWIPLYSGEDMGFGTQDGGETLDDNMDISSVVASGKARNMVVDTGRRVVIVWVGTVGILF